MNGEVINVWCICKYIHLMTKYHTHAYILYNAEIRMSYILYLNELRVSQSEC